MIQEIINPIKEVDFLGDNRFLLQPLTQSQLSSMIRSRNDKFILLLERFVDKYETKKSEKSLLKKAAELIPQEPDLQDMVEVLQEKKSVTTDSGHNFSTDEMIQILENSKFYCDQIASTQLLNRNRPADFRS